MAMLFETLINELEGLERSGALSGCSNNSRSSSKCPRNYGQSHGYPMRNHPYAAFFPFDLSMDVESSDSESQSETEQQQQPEKSTADSSKCAKQDAKQQKPKFAKLQKQCQRKYVPTKSPAVDFIETERNYNIAVELPGVSKDSIDIELENGILTVSTGETVATKVEQILAPVASPENSMDIEKDQQQVEEDDNDTSSDSSAVLVNGSDDVNVESLVDKEDAFSSDDVEAENLAKALGKKRKQQEKMDTNNNSSSSNDYVHKHIERGVRRYKRSFKLDKRVSSQSITASYENGVLQLTIAKPIKKSPERISIM